MKRNCLALAVGVALAVTAPLSFAQTDGTAAASNKAAAPQRQSVSSTSNTTRSNDTKRAAAQLGAVSVQADTLSIGSGMMEVQTAPKAVSTISREAITQAAPGATFVQMLGSIPGVNASTDDNTGLNDGNLTVRGYTMDEVGVTVNGAPINDSGNYKIYATEYGDTENMGDITVQQGYPDQDSPMAGAAGGSVAWVTIDPSHKAGVDVSQSYGSYGYRRTFVRLNTGDTGPFRSWVSYSDNQVNNWRGPGGSKVGKVDAKSIWTINDKNTVSFSLQYNREGKTSYEGMYKSDVAAGLYKTSYSPTFHAGSLSNSSFYRYHYNPFHSLLVSMDGEFTLSDNLHLSVVPYFQYGNGGVTTSGQLSEDGSDPYVMSSKQGGTRQLVGSFIYSNTYRPGVIAKLNQDFGDNDSLEYGIWTEEARQQQGNNYTPVDPQTGIQANNWGNGNLITNQAGQTLQAWDQYTDSTTRKAFVTNTWTPNDQWTINASVAYLWMERKGYSYTYDGAFTAKDVLQNASGGYQQQSWHKVTPTLGVKYQLDDRNQFYLGVGQTFRAPIGGALYNPLFNSAETKSIASKPESSWTYDLGWRFYGSRISAVVDAYASDFSNKQLTGTNQETSESVYLSLGKVHMRGLNTELNVKLSQDWSIYGSYSYTQAIMESNLNTGYAVYSTHGRTLLNTPRNLLNIGVSFTHGPVWATLSTRTSSAFYGDWMNTEKVGGYTTLNLNAGWNFHDWGFMRKPYIKINGFNLLNRRAFTFASNVTAFQATAGQTPYYSLLEGRSGMITVGASFF